MSTDDGPRPGAYPEQADLLRHGPEGAAPFAEPQPVPVESIALQEPLYVSPDTRLGDVARALAAGGRSACLVGGPGAVLGIVTERDVVRGLGEHGSGAASLAVSHVMTPRLVTVADTELTHEAALRMVEHGIRRLAVCTAAGQIRGLLEERHLLAAGRETPLAVLAALDEARDVAALRDAFAGVRGFLLRMASAGLPAARVARLAAQLHDRVLLRTLDMTVAAMPIAPPAPFALALLGSHARREQFFATDQDCAWVISDASGDVPEAVQDQWFAQCGGSFAQMLQGVGVPPCPHGVMPSFAVWRRTVDSWCAAVDAAFERPGSEGVLLVSTLVDMRGLHDGYGLCARVTEHLHRRAGEHPLLLRYMAREALRYPPPLGLFKGLFGGLAVERGPHGSETVDIKMGGVFAIMQGVRAMALDARLDVTDTPGRLQALGEAGVMRPALVADVLHAWGVLLGMRLREQVEALRLGREPSNRVDVQALAPLERETLRQCFKVVAELQAFVEDRYRLQYLG